jgi:glycosyltransferase involved in cell wall biosynthesis
MSPPLCEIETFVGSKDTIAGKLAALRGLAGLARIGRQFEAYVRDNQIDVVICTMLSIWDVAVLPALRRMGAPFVLVMHDANPHPGDSYPFRRLAMRQEIAAADGVVVLTDHVRQQAMQCHDISADRLWIIPHGSFDFGAAGQRCLPPDRPPRLLFFGRILAYKGLGLLLDAYRQLRREGVQVELDVMGSGDVSPYGSKLAGLEGVRLTNRWLDDDEIGPALAHSEIMVLPYVEASQSGVAAAAAAAGIPTVATPVGGLAEQIRHEETGLVCDAVTPTSLAAAIRRLVESPALYAACSAGALAHARADLSWDMIGAQMMDVAREVVRRAGVERPV